MVYIVNTFQSYFKQTSLIQNFLGARNNTLHGKYEFLFRTKATFTQKMITEIKSVPLMISTSKIITNVIDFSSPVFSVQKNKNNSFCDGDRH